MKRESRFSVSLAKRGHTGPVVMAVAQGPFLLLLVSAGIHCSTPPPICPESCTCQRAPLLNCSSTDLSFVPQPIQDSVTELDLSHNLLDSVTLHWPHRNLRNVWLGNNTITHLSLCIERSLGSQSASGGHLHRFRPWSRGRCVSWAPTLQLLSVERNELVQFPEGLEGSASLRVLQLSFNRISTLQPGDLSHLRQLKELYLQHNLITSLHPQMFQDLAHLRVLDLSFNMLTSLHPLMYLSLRNIGANVRLDGNWWQCDCSMRSLRRRMAHDSSRDLQVWSMVCVFPSILSGKDLLQLEEDDLNCFGTESKPDHHQDVTVYSGSEILLSCSAQDSVWWTPSGQAPVSQNQADLLISEVTERDTGLYVCMSEEHEVVSVYNLKISRIQGAERKTRSLSRASQQLIPQDTQKKISEERNQRATQSDLALAVCLSVFITFLIAFILGVLARPCIDVLWKKVTNKKSRSVSSVEQRQYENEAYSSGEEPEEIITNRERRVTFSTIDFREDSNVQYYDTVASGDHESINNDAVIECETAKAEEENHPAGDSGSEISLQRSSPGNNLKDGRDLSGITNAGGTVKMEFEHIPDHNELEERRSLSSCSNSSLSDRDHTTPKSPLQAEDSIQQRYDFSTSRKVEVPQISIEEKSEIPGFSSEPFADWSPHTENTNPTDSNLWQENEEQFEFSDSVRSTSARSSSVFGSFNDSKLIVVPTANKQNRDDISSSSSYVSDDEPTQYTVNSDQEEMEENTKRNNKKSVVINSCLEQDASYEQQVQGVDPSKPSVGFNQGDYRHDAQRPAERPAHPLSSHSSDSKSEPMWGEGKGKSISKYDKLSREKVKPIPRTKWRGLSLGVTSFGKSLDISTPSPPTAYSASSSNESEAEITDLNVKDKKRKSPPMDSSSSDESSDQTMDFMKKQKQKQRLPFQESQKTVSHVPDTQWPGLDLEHTTLIKRHLDIKTPSPDSDSSSSSDSEDETADHTVKQRPARVDNAELQKSQQVTHDSDEQWSALDLEHIPSIKRHLDIKVSSPPAYSASNNKMVEEKIAQIKKYGQGEKNMSKQSQAESHDSGTLWPVLDLDHTTHNKRRLDIKVTSPDSDSSSSSDSEEETTNPTKKQEQEAIHMARLPNKVSPTVNLDSEIQWPLLDLEYTKHIKRRLDIKAPSPGYDSSEAEISLQKSQTVSHDPNATWPAVDLENIPHIKRRLDIKTPSPDSDSSSSSDSEDETADHTVKQRPARVDNAELQKSQQVTHDPDEQWPALDLEHIPSIKRRLDMKVSSPPAYSASNNKMVEEKIAQIKKYGQGEENMSKQSQAESHDSGTLRPFLDLDHTTHIKRRLDIKVTSPDSDSSSSSDSEEETTNPTKKQEQEAIHMARLPNKVSPTVNLDSEIQWPLLDLEYTKHIKRRLDIKAPSPGYDSSEAEISLQKSQTVSHDPNATWPAVDLENIPHIKRRLDIKTPSPDSDSSSSSDREDETADHTVKQRPARVDNVELQKTQQVTHDPDEQWPALDLEHIPSIKRRLDMKVSSPPAYSASNNKMVEEKIAQIKKYGQGEENMSKQSQAESHDSGTLRPFLDLDHTTHIKRRLDIKVTSPDSDSSSSSDSEEETTNPTKKQEQEAIHMARLPNKVSPTVNLDSEIQWPLLDLEYTKHIKRRLDIKAPSPGYDSSEAEISLQKSQTVSHDPNATWPAVDLENIPHIKRRLDIKTPSPDSDSSSSSDSEDETADHTVKQRPARVDNAELQKSQQVTHDPDERWSALDLEHIPSIKRRLDIKVTSPDSDSSSSSDSEDETTNPIKKQEQEEIHMARLPNNVSPTVSHDSETQWPLLDLEYTTRIKKRLDIKAPSPDSDSSSSSDSEDETADYTVKQRRAKVDNAELQKSQKVTYDPDERWSALDLEHIPSIKRRLDIKVPSPPAYSASNNKMVEEKIAQIKKYGQGEENMSKQSPEESHDSGTLWPVLDLDHTTHIKRRLDIKAPVCDSSSSSEDETTNPIKKQEQVARLPNKVSPTVSHDSETQWPLLDLEYTKHIKRRLDIKPPSPDSDSSSCSDNEDETTHQRPGEVDISLIKKHEQGEVHIKVPLQKSQTLNHDSEILWPAVDLGNISHIKRRLDIKAPSSHPDSLGTGSRNHTVKERMEESNKITPCYPSSSSVKQKKNREDLSNTPSTGEQEPHPKWPQLGLSSLPHVKRRLDIKTHSSPNESSSSTDESDSGTIDLHVKMESERTDEGIRNQPGAKLDESVPSVKRRFNIKAPPQQADSCSSSSDSESLSSHTVKSRDKVDVGITNQEQLTMLHELNLGVPHINRHLNIKPLSPQPDLVLSSVSVGTQQSRSNSSGSESEGENRDHNVKVEMGVSVISKASDKELIRFPKTPGINISHNPKTDHNIKLENDAVISDDLKDKPTTDNISTTPEINPELQSRWATMNLGISRFRKRLEITSHTHVPPNLPTSLPPDSSLNNKSETGSKRTLLQRSSSSSNSENEIIDHSVSDLRLGVPHFKRHLKVPSSEPNNSPSSCSESENEVTEYTVQESRHASNMSVMTENDSHITYKRLIIKSSLQSQTVDHAETVTVAQDGLSHSVGDRNVSLSPKISSMSFDDIIRKRTGLPRSTTDADLPLEIRWTGIGRHLSDFSMSSSNRGLDVGLSSSLQDPPAEPELRPPDSTDFSFYSTKSGDKLKQDRGPAIVSLVHEYSSLGTNSVSLTTSRTLDKFDNSRVSTNEILRAVSEDRRERKGLSALKSISSERRKWDKENGDYIDIGASPPCNDRGPQCDSSRFEENIMPLAKRPQTQLRTPLPSVDAGGVADLLYTIPSYRRHDFGDVEPPQEAPPPIPTTPPPDEAFGHTWRSPQSNKTQGWKDTYLRHSGNMD